MTIRTIILLIVCSLSPLCAQEVSQYIGPTGGNMTRADIWFCNTVPNPRAILIICPGINGSAENFARNPKWQSFAMENNIALAGLSFASPTTDLYAGRGYTYPEQGSGRILLDAIKVKYGKDLPLILYGFSSGALFTELMVNWKPDQVLTWCAHATGRYENNPKPWPPGIVSCGENDSERFGAALTHFKKGRAAKSELLWIGLKNCNHEWPDRLHDFVQHYFAEVLKSGHDDTWVDIDTMRSLSDSMARRRPALSGWLPSKDLFDEWKMINE
jgi:hypothetical protein